jgi:hypothetical protein
MVFGAVYHHHATVTTVCQSLNQRIGFLYNVIDIRGAGWLEFA